MTREEACVKFCEGLTDGTLSQSNGTGFTALMLFRQRDMAFQNLAVHGIPVYKDDGRVNDGGANTIEG